MAVATTDYYIDPTQGWVQVGTSPASITIKPDTFHNWFVAVSPGAPATSLIGVAMGNDAYNRMEPFVAGAIVGNVYIRIMTPPDSVVGSKMRFGVITA